MKEKINIRLTEFLVPIHRVPVWFVYISQTRDSWLNGWTICTYF